MTTALGIQTSLAVPGVVPVVGADGLSDLEQLDRAFGVAGQFASQAEGRVRSVIANRNRDAAEIEAEYRGKAALDLQTDLPEFLNAVDQGQINVGDMDPSEYAESVLNEKLGSADVPDVYKEAYRRIAQPAIIRAFAAQQQRRYVAGRDEAAQLTTEAVYAAESPDAVRQALDGFRSAYGDDPAITETDIVGLARPGMQRAADAGNVVRFNRIADAIGDRLPIERDALARLAQQRQAAVAAESQAQAIQATENRLAELGMLPTPPITEMRQVVQESGLPATSQSRMSARIDRIEAEIDGRLEQQAVRYAQEAALGNVPVGEASAAFQAIYNDEVRTVAATVAYARDRLNLAARNGDVAEVQSISRELPDTAASQINTQVALEQARAVSSQRRVDRIESQLFSQQMTPAAALNLAVDGARRHASDPNDPLAIHPDDVRAIRNAAASRQQIDVSMQRVLTAEQGGAVSVSESEDGSAIDRRVHELGLINQAGMITDPEALGDYIVNVGTATNGIRTRLIDNLTAQPLEASIAIGKIAQGLPIENDKLMRAAGPREKQAAEAIRQFEAGRLIDEQARTAALSQIAATPLREAEQRRVAEIRQRYLDATKSSDDDLSRLSADIVNEAIDQLGLPGGFVPGTLGTLTFGLLGGDFAATRDGQLESDPAAFVEQRMLEAFDRYDDMAMPLAEQIDRSRRDARAAVAASFDFVRWGDVLTGHRIDTARGPMPASLRWQPFFEEEAVDAIRELGHDPDDIIGVQPYTAAESRDEWGWQFITNEDAVLQTDGGQVAVFRPSDASQRRAEMLQNKSARFEVTGGLPLYVRIARLLGPPRPSQQQMIQDAINQGKTHAYPGGPLLADELARIQQSP